MNLDDYKNWEEVISKENFQNLLEQLIENKSKYETCIFIEMLETLSEKYSKFYEPLLNFNQSDKINQILIELTDFSNLDRIQTLIGILFNFKVDIYFEYLTKHRYTIISIPVKNEIEESLIEYQATKNRF